MTNFQSAAGFANVVPWCIWFSESRNKHAY